MRIAPAVVLVGALTLGACATPNDVRSTGWSSSAEGEHLPPVDDPEPATTPVAPTTVKVLTTAEAAAAAPETRPTDLGSKVLLFSDLPEWNVSRPVETAGRETFRTLDCPDMQQAWDATGRAGVRSSGDYEDASFRNTAVEFPTAAEASDLLDAVDRVSKECPEFENSSANFWSMRIDMPESTLRTSGISIGNRYFENWTLAFWQNGATVIALEVQGDDMWTHLEPLLATLSARLDGTPTTIDDTDATTSATPAPDRAETDWLQHPLARLAPTTAELGPGWIYNGGSRHDAAPADPNEAIDGCDAPPPPTLDGYEVQYGRVEPGGELTITVGDGAAADSQLWIEAFRAIAACELDIPDFASHFDLVDHTIEGADDSVVLAGRSDTNFDATYLQAFGAARIDGVVVVASVAVLETDPSSTGAAIAQVGDVLESMLAAR